MKANTPQASAAKPKNRKMQTMTTVRKSPTEANTPICISFEIEPNSASARMIRALQGLSPVLRQRAWAIVAAELEKSAENALENFDCLQCILDTSEEFISRLKRCVPKSKTPKKVQRSSSSPVASKAQK
jgi:hypothetical protein